MSPRRRTDWEPKLCIIACTVLLLLIILSWPSHISRVPRPNEYSTDWAARFSTARQSFGDRNRWPYMPREKRVLRAFGTQTSVYERAIARLAVFPALTATQKLELAYYRQALALATELSTNPVAAGQYAVVHNVRSISWMPLIVYTLVAVLLSIIGWSVRRLARMEKERPVST